MKYFFLIFGIVLFSSCESEKINKEVSIIKYGTSFGECLGYCINEMELGTVEVKLVQKGWQNDIDPRYITRSISNNDWEKIEKLYAYDIFKNIPDVIGCPDCADGGAEWIEITLPEGQSHKITFEYNATIDSIQPLIEYLRALKLELVP